jgi:hypothetical protein
VVVHSNRQGTFGARLPDHVLVQRIHDLARLGQVAARGRALFLQLLTDDVVAQLDAFIADEHAGPGDQLAHLVLALSAERAVKDLAAFARPALSLVTHSSVVPMDLWSCSGDPAVSRWRPSMRPDLQPYQ